jgi:hypothetical protein
MVAEQKQTSEEKSLNEYLRIVADREMSRLPNWKTVPSDLKRHLAADSHRAITRLLRYSREIVRRYPSAIQEMMCIPDMTLLERGEMAMDADTEWAFEARIETPDAFNLRLRQICEGSNELENVLKQIMALSMQGRVVAPLLEQFKKFPRLYNFAHAFQL